jgi:hypothetical protein
MHEYLKQAREGAAKKLKGIQSGEPHTKVDSSSWSPPEMLEADKQNGMRPVSKRQYKSGGKVCGADAKKRADRKARKDGGSAMPPVDRFLNRDMKKANEYRDGVKKVGGMKKGGRIKRAEGGDAPKDDIAKLIRQDEIEQGMKGRGLPERVPLPPRRPAPAPEKPYTGPKPTSNPNYGYKKGGKAAHPDVAEDKKLIKKMIKPSAMKKADGGKAKSPTPDELRAMYAAGKAKMAADPDYQKKLMQERPSGYENLVKMGQKSGGKVGRADGGEAGRGLYARQGYPHDVPGVDGGRVAKRVGGPLGKKKGTTNIHVNVMPHSGAGQAPVMPLPVPVPPRPVAAPSMPPQGMPMGAPMGGGADLPAMGAGRPGMPPIARKLGGKVKTDMKTVHVIDHAAGGGLGRMEKIDEYGLK